MMGVHQCASTRRWRGILDVPRCSGVRDVRQYVSVSLVGDGTERLLARPRYVGAPALTLDPKP